MLVTVVCAIRLTLILKSAQARCELRMHVFFLETKNRVTRGLTVHAIFHKVFCQLSLYIVLLSIPLCLPLLTFIPIDIVLFSKSDFTLATSAYILKLRPTRFVGLAKFKAVKLQNHKLRFSDLKMSFI